MVTPFDSEQPLAPDARRPVQWQIVEPVLSRVGDKWSMPTVSLLGDGARRFNDVRRTLGNISQRMLTLTVRNLERDGLVKRTVYPTNPPRVDYELTELGHALWHSLQNLLDWAHRHRADIDDARRAFDDAGERAQPASRTQV